MPNSVHDARALRVERCRASGLITASFHLEPHDLASANASRGAPFVGQVFDQEEAISTISGAGRLDHLWHSILTIAYADSQEWVPPVDREVDRRPGVQYGVRDEFAREQRDDVGLHSVNAPHVEGIADKAT